MALMSRHGYGLLKSGFEEGDEERLKEFLTVSPKDLFSMGSGPGDTSSTFVSSFPCYRENSTRLYLPKALGLQEYGLPSKDTTPEAERLPADVTFIGTLRDYQEEAVSKIVDACEDPLRRGGLLCLYPGAGKTTCALAAAARLGVKTMVVVHKDFLLQQWRERIGQYLPEATTGILKGKKLEIHGRDIVLATLQSLSMKEFPKETFDGFGLVIVDECHHIGAEVFSRALHRLNFRYSIGLSATPTRKDGLTKVIKWFIGNIVYKGKKRQDTVDVMIREYFSTHPAYSTEYQLYNGRPNSALMLNKIAAFQPRTAFLVEIIREVKSTAPERNVLILSDRREHLSDLEPLLAEIPHVTRVGYYVGGMKETALRDTEQTCDVILATFSMASEGMDIPKLDTLLLATPKSDVEQSVGRVQRKGASADHCPLVIDVVDRFSLFQRQAQKRMKFYQKMKYKIMHNGQSQSQSQSQSQDDDTNSLTKKLQGMQAFLDDGE